MAPAFSKSTAGKCTNSRPPANHTACAISHSSYPPRLKDLPCRDCSLWLRYAMMMATIIPATPNTSVMRVSGLIAGCCVDFIGQGVGDRASIEDVQLPEPMLVLEIWASALEKAHIRTSEVHCKRFHRPLRGTTDLVHLARDVSTRHSAS